jgi:hypothetical protein
MNLGHGTLGSVGGWLKPNLPGPASPPDKRRDPPSPRSSPQRRRKLVPEENLKAILVQAERVRMMAH